MSLQLPPPLTQHQMKPHSLFQGAAPALRADVLRAAEQMCQGKAAGTDGISENVYKLGVAI